jgi:hypothetical protein
MLICPQSGSRISAAGICKARGRADSGGTIRSRAGMTTSEGLSIFLRRHRFAGNLPFSGNRFVIQIPSRQRPAAKGRGVNPRRHSPNPRPQRKALHPDSFDPYRQRPRNFRAMRLGSTPAKQHLKPFHRHVFQVSNALQPVFLCPCLNGPRQNCLWPRLQKSQGVAIKHNPLNLSGNRVSAGSQQKPRPCSTQARTAAKSLSCASQSRHFPNALRHSLIQSRKCRVVA